MQKTKQAISTETVWEPFWALSVEETLAILHVNTNGLPQDEVITRQKLFGPNKIQEKELLTPIRIALSQLKNPLMIILFVAGLLSAILGKWVETSVIIATILANAALGFWQEYKAESALQLLKSYSRIITRTRRENKDQEIDSIELVPGDIVRITQGDRVPADGRIIFANNLEIDESVITGESLPVSKNDRAVGTTTLVAERKCMALDGTLVMQGFGDIVITATGSHTEFGKIAALIAKERERTPLQRSIFRFAGRAGIFLGTISLGLFVFGLTRGEDLYEMFLIAIAVAVHSVPAALPVALTVVLAIGVQRLASKKAIARKLLAAETLGSTTLILTDKTGTLTQAKMELTSLLPYSITAKNAAAKEMTLLKEALINTDVVIENPNDDFSQWKMFGRALELSLVRAAASRGLNYHQFTQECKIYDRLPFTSERKFSVAVYHARGETRMTFLGAPDILAKHCHLPSTELALLEKEINARAHSGERVLGVASVEIKNQKENKLEQFFATGDNKKEFKVPHLQFQGLLAFRDPLRPGMVHAISRIGKAGVKTVIVTGDHRGTAEFVARELKLFGERTHVFTGDDLARFSDKELAVSATHAAVYARVTPEQKLRITKAYKALGETVAVTGDGVNDAPALNIADIGVAVGSGTEVAKASSDLVLLDDNFETLVSAIEEGRRIAENIRKIIVFLLTNVFDGLFLIGGALLMGLALPLNALQILFVNFITNSFPAIGLALEPGVDQLQSKPSKLSHMLLDNQMKFMILVIGVLTSLALFGFYVALLQQGYPAELVRTFVFGAFASYSLFFVFALRSMEKQITRFQPLGNKYITAGAITGMALTLSAIYFPPMQFILNTVPLPPLWLAGIVGFGLINIVAAEFAKFLFRRGIIKN